jgi:putative ABC transport system permease protein
MNMTEGLRRDVTVGLRGLGRQPAFAVAALVTLALGIGANTAVFSVIRHVLLSPLPYKDPGRVVMIWSKWRGFDKTWVSDAEALDYRHVSAFEDAGAWGGSQVNLTGEGADPARVGAAFITPNSFAVLGVSPRIGRPFTDAEAQPKVATVVVLSDTLWRQRFAADDQVIGKQILVNGIARDIVGVMPPGFRLPTDYVSDAEEPAALFLPGSLDPTNRGSHGFYAAARLKPGVTLAQANAELLALTTQWTKDGKYPVPMQFSAFAISTTDEAVAAVRPALILLFVAVGFLLLIACANVANLLLVRADGRTREMALRSALGADRMRLVRQLMTESAVLAAGAAILGIGLAMIAIRFVTAMHATTLPRAGEVRVDAPVLVFSVAMTIGTLLVFSLLPAFRAARVDLVESLKDGSANASAGRARQRLRGGLVIAETAMAVILLSGAGLMLRSLWSLQRIDLGFNPDRVLTMRLALPASQYDTAEKSVAFYQNLLSRVRALPGVERAGLERLLPLATAIGDWGLTVEGYAPPAGVGTPGDWQIASAGGPEALGERLIRGRWLADSDAIGTQDVALINESMARKYWAGQDPVGRRFRMGSNLPAPPWITVVGIVGDVKHNGVTSEVKPKFYRAFAQFQQSSGNPARNLTLIVKTAGDPLALVASVRTEIRRLDAHLPVAAVRTMNDIVADSIATPRIAGWLLGLFAALALLLAAVGIYSVLAYVVSQRRQEIGIRVALGAGRADVLLLILRSGLTLTATGVIVGLGIAALAGRALANQLHDVEPLDPATFASVAALLAAVSISACLIPAIRASRVSPTRALRAD